jgi:sulfur carrier protein ThiS
MNVTVNGKERKLNIGCRTFISVIELLNILEVKQDLPVALSLNGEIIHWQNVPGTAVSSGDTVVISGIPM